MIKLGRLVRFIFDKYQFRKNQLDYFLYLSQLLTGSKGQLTLKAIFAADRQRYGPQHFRGRLAARWLCDFERNGGDLAQTWQPWVSYEAWLFIRLSQSQGAEVLVQALQQLSQQLQQKKHLHREWLALLGPALVALLLCVLMLALIPLYTVPALLEVFSTVPTELYGSRTRSLLWLAKVVQHYGGIILFLVLLSASAVFYSLSHYCGGLRRYLDRLEPWGSYKSLYAWRLMALLALLLKRSMGQLRFAAALALLSTGSNPWFEEYLQRIQQRVVHGEAGAKSLDVGLLSNDMLWFLMDMEQCQGIAQALLITAERQQQVLYSKLRLKGVAWRWFLLLFCVCFLLLIGGWHYAVIDEFRRALLMFYSSY